MNAVHPNVEILRRFDPTNIQSAKEILAKDFVWHFFNSKLPELQGDYRGAGELRHFFERLGVLTKGSFKVNPVSVIPIGEELVVVHSLNEMVLEDEPIEIDAVVVWRFVDGRITEAWDIPAVHHPRPAPVTS